MPLFVTALCDIPKYGHLPRDPASERRRDALMKKKKLFFPENYAAILVGSPERIMPLFVTALCDKKNANLYVGENSSGLVGKEVRHY